MFPFILLFCFFQGLLMFGNKVTVSNSFTKLVLGQRKGYVSNSDYKVEIWSKMRLQFGAQITKLKLGQRFMDYKKKNWYTMDVITIGPRFKNCFYVFGEGHWHYFNFKWSTICYLRSMKSKHKFKYWISWYIITEILNVKNISHKCEK